jgi:hypothetical protein
MSSILLDLLFDVAAGVGGVALDVAAELRCWLTCPQHDHDALRRRAEAAEAELMASRLADSATRRELDARRREVDRYRAGRWLS